MCILFSIDTIYDNVLKAGEKMWKRKTVIVKDLLIFLDVDGVLNTTNSRITKYEIRTENIKALGVLKDRLKKQGFSVKIVLSSTWRIGYDADFDKCSKQIKHLISKLVDFDMKIYDKTPVYKEQSRDVEIRRYIRGYQLKNEKFSYIILDDDSSVFDKETLKTMTFYKVNEHTGLTLTDVEKIAKIFK